MRAYRFLRQDATDPLTGARWRTDAWLSPSGGVVACREEDLPHWLAPELWIVELAGRVVERPHSLLAERGRLVERLEAWDGQAQLDFLRWCRERHPAMGVSAVDIGWSAACVAGYVASQSAGMDAAARGGSYEQAERAERAEQGAWVRLRLGAA